jgi:hypothetical protein
MQESDRIKDNDGECESDDKGCNNLKKKMEGKKQLKSCLERINNYLKCDIPTTPQPSTYQPVINPIDSYCGDISGLACLANLAQDVATLTDLVGVGLIEAPAVAAGCIDGGPLGCVIAEVGVAATWTVTLNNVETGASSVSLGLTVIDDFANNGGWGENSSTSLATWAAGLLPLIPSWDLAVDTYSSGYNHGFFNGVHTIWTDGIFK